MMTSGTETVAEKDAVFDAMLTAFRDRAGLLGAFDPFHVLENVVPRPQDEAMEARILNSVAPSIEEVIVDEQLCWQLRPDARRKILASLAARNAIRSTLRVARPGKNDRFGKILQATLKSGKRLGPQAPSSDLQLQAVALDFVRDLPFERKAPRDAAIDPRILLARRAERNRLDHVAPKLFGRDKDSEALDNYVLRGEITAPIKRLEVRVASDADGAPRLRPLLVTGIGGSGKSAIMADLTRRTQRDDWSGPIVLCLDFDQRNVAMGAEREWLNELTRQIGFARPRLDRALSTVRGDARRALNRTSAVPEAVSGNDTLKIVSAMRDGLARVLDEAGATNGDLVVLIDTFEEVLVRSDMVSDTLWQEPFGLVLDFLDSLARLRCGSGPVFGSVRAIVAGRARPLPDRPDLLADWFEAHLEIGELDVEAATAFLRDRSDRRVFSKTRSLQLAEFLPRFPLVLTLLVDFARNRSAREIDELVEAGDMAAPLAADAAIRVLYSRFLERLVDHEIRDPATGEKRLIEKGDLIKLAHPGLVLPVVNARLICEVLAQPAGLGDISLQRAEDLLAALSREVWLVERTGTEGVRHVPVLRRIMLPMLLGDAVGPRTGLQNAVRAVHLAAANWYGPGGAGAETADAQAHAAYHRAFLGDVGALEDAALARQVLELAGEDIFAMPIKARALLKREQKSDSALSAAETAALPEAMRDTATATRNARRTKSGVTSRQSEKAYRTAGHQDGISIGASLSSIPSSLPSGVSASSTPGSDHAAFLPNGHTRETLSTLLHDSRTTDLIQSAFAEADFARVVELGAPTMEAIPGAGIADAPFDTIYEPTSHWTWKWALSCLATRAADDNFVRWVTHIGPPAGNEPGRAESLRVSAITALAIAAVALGRPPQLTDDPGYQAQAFASLTVLGQSSEVRNLSTLRMLSLAGYLTPDRLSKTATPLEISSKLLRLAAFWPEMTRSALPTVAGPGQLVSIPDRIASRLLEFTRSPPRNSDLIMLDELGTIRLFPQEQFPLVVSGPLPKPLAPAYGQLIRGRTPELYDPVRAAFGDIADDEPSVFAETVEDVSSMAPFWPADLARGALESLLRHRREADYVLAGLVSFLDLSGLTVEFMRRLALRVKTGPRFDAVMRLYVDYDRLLLTPFDAVDYLPSQQSSPKGASS